MSELAEDLRGRYLAAQLAGNPREALRLIVDEGIGRGLSARDIHLIATNLLEDEKTDPADLRRFGQTIGRQARHLGRLVDDLLDVSRITSGKIHLAKRPLDLVRLTGTILESSYPTVDRGRHDLVTKLPDREIWVDGDATRLEQVLGNLLTNALKYTQEGGKVTVAVETREDVHGARGVFTITDEGRGIAPENIASVWDLFFQIDNSLARPQSGLGVGLTMVRRLIEMHGGSVAVMSEGIDKGTTFSFELPQIPAPKERDEGPALDAHAAAAEGPARRRQRRCLRAICLCHRKAGARGGVRESRRRRPRTCHLGPLRRRDLRYRAPRSRWLRARAAHEEDARRLVALPHRAHGLRPQDRASALEAGFDVHLVKPLDVALVTSLFADVIAKKRERMLTSDDTRGDRLSP